jgi:hypothetical protein
MRHHQTASLLASRLAAPATASRGRAGLIEQSKSTKAGRTIPAGITQGEEI